MAATKSKMATDASSPNPAALSPEEIAAASPTAVADPGPAPALEEASGAIIEPAIIEAIDVSHESVDANPRVGTSALQNAIDFNDAKRVNPSDPSFAGLGVDLSVYGNPSATPAETVAAPETARTAAAKSSDA